MGTLRMEEIGTDYKMTNQKGFSNRDTAPLISSLMHLSGIYNVLMYLAT